MKFTNNQKYYKLLYSDKLNSIRLTILNLYYFLLKCAIKITNNNSYYCNQSLHNYSSQK